MPISPSNVIRNRLGIVARSRPTLLFFKEDRFLADLQANDPLQVFRDALNAANRHLDTRFVQGERISKLIQDRALFIDRILTIAWDRLNWDDNITLVAVGGYGRLELHPYSDVDLLILTRRDNHRRYQANISNFLTFLWDIGLKIGHSVRSIKHCVREAKADVTVATNLLESRPLSGNRELFHKMSVRTRSNKVWSSRAFFEAKRAEQDQRHAKHDNIEYNLEPNIKEAPGGLRDIQIISWIAKHHYGVSNLIELVGTDFLSEEEFQLITQGEEFLWRVRYGLHMIAGRPEERLSFEHQRKLAELFSYRDTDERLAVEQFMQRYYRVVLAMHEQNDVLMQYVAEVIFSDRQRLATRALNERFQVCDRHIEAISDTLFEDNPSALLEVFVLLGENPDIDGVRSETIRQIRENRHRIDEAFRADETNRALFMRLFRCQGKLSTQLQRMTRYGVLGKYLPEFDRIVGQMQHDLFHIYPVDVHSILVVRNLRRLGNLELAQTFPVASHVVKNLPKPEILLIAGLFHDIAKGRGGDHSKLGGAVVEEFARKHDFTDQEARLLRWLVENHLLMSSVSQREDISDPDVIYKFAELVGNQLYLDYLFTLTVADINATNPSLWTSWKGSLMRQLYFSSREALKRGLENPANRQEWIDNTRAQALTILAEHDIPKAQTLDLWADLDDELFLRESANVIARLTEKTYLASDDDGPVVVIEDAGVEDTSATRIFIHTKGARDVFPITAATLDSIYINIVDAQLYTGCRQRHTFDIFYVLDEHGQPFGENPEKSRQVRDALIKALKSPSGKIKSVQRRTPRQLKQMTIGTSARIDNTVSENTSYLEVITPDRPGLLAQLGQIFLHFNLHLHSAKIATLGERVEDVFYITDEQDHPITDAALCREIEQTICRRLDSRNLDDTSSGTPPQLLNTRTADTAGLSAPKH